MYEKVIILSFASSNPRAVFAIKTDAQSTFIDENKQTDAQKFRPCFLLQKSENNTKYISFYLHWYIPVYTDPSEDNPLCSKALFLDEAFTKKRTHFDLVVKKGS